MKQDVSCSLFYVDNIRPCRGFFNSFNRVVIIFIPENRIKTVAVNAYIVIAYISEKAVCCVAFKVFVFPLCFYQGTPLVGVMARRARDIAYIRLFT